MPDTRIASLTATGPDGIVVELQTDGAGRLLSGRPPVDRLEAAVRHSVGRVPERGAGRGGGGQSLGVVAGG